MLLQSPYLTFEYLLWRKYNLGHNIDTNIKVAYLDTSSRNLIATISDADDTGLILLKQFSGSDNKKSFIENEYSILQHLLSNEDLKSWLPQIYFYDPSHRLLAIEYLNEFINLNGIFTKLKTEKKWNNIRRIASEIGQFLSSIHKCATSDLKIPSSTGVQILPLDIGDLKKYDAHDLAFLFTQWDPKTIIHFDPRLANFLYKNDESLKLIDWELAVIGDPLWDLSIIIYSICTFSNTNFFLNRNTSSQPSFFDDFKSVIQSLLLTYNNSQMISDDALVKLKKYLNLQIQKSGMFKSSTNQNTINGLFMY